MLWRPWFLAGERAGPRPHCSADQPTAVFGAAADPIESHSGCNSSTACVPLSPLGSTEIVHGDEFLRPIEPPNISFSLHVLLLRALAMHPTPVMPLTRSHPLARTGRHIVAADGGGGHHPAGDLDSLRLVRGTLACPHGASLSPSRTLLIIHERRCWQCQVVGEFSLQSLTPCSYFPRQHVLGA